MKGYGKEKVEIMLGEVDDLLGDYMDIDREGGVKEDPRMGKRCEYHVHKEWQICPTSGKRYGVRKDGASRRRKGADEKDLEEGERHVKRFKNL